MDLEAGKKNARLYDRNFNYFIVKHLIQIFMDKTIKTIYVKSIISN